MNTNAPVNTLINDENLSITGTVYHFGIGFAISSVRYFSKGVPALF